MRLAYVCADPGVPVFGSKGCSIHVQQVVRCLSARGAQIVVIAASTGGDMPPAAMGGIRLVRIPIPKRRDSESREKDLYQANESIAQIIRTVGPLDAVYERQSLWSCAAMEEAATLGIPGVLEVNAPLLEEQAKYRTLHNRDAAEETALRAFRAASSILAVSSEVADYILKQCTEANVQVVPNGVDFERFTEKERSTEKTITIGFVGSLKPWHGVESLLRAFATLAARHAHLRLRIVGDGPLRSTLEDQIKDHGLSDRVDLIGAIPHADVPTHLAKMDIAVAPYPQLDDFYFSPLKLFEYMGAGCAVVASDIGQIQNVLTHGENGLLCTAGDEDSLSESLERLIQDDSMRVRLGQCARKTIQSQYTWDHVASRIWTLMQPPTIVRAV